MSWRWANVGPWREATAIPLSAETAERELFWRVARGSWKPVLGGACLVFGENAYRSTLARYDGKHFWLHFFERTAVKVVAAATPAEQAPGGLDLAENSRCISHQNDYSEGADRGHDPDHNN